MPTLADSVHNAANALNNAVARILGLRAEFDQKVAQALLDSRQIVKEATPIAQVWVVDPTDGNDANDGKTLATAFKTLHAVCLIAAPATKHLVYLTGDITHAHYSSISADITVRGSTKAPGSDGFMFGSTRRRVTFVPEAVNSPLYANYRTTSAFALAGSRLSFLRCDLIMADVAAGLQMAAHLYCGGGNVSIDQGDIYATTNSNPGRLIFGNSTEPTGLWVSGAIAVAARGRIFEGVAAGADPNANKRYNTNLTQN